MKPGGCHSGKEAAGGVGLKKPEKNETEEGRPPKKVKHTSVKWQDRGEKWPEPRTGAQKHRSGLLLKKLNTIEKIKWLRRGETINMYDNAFPNAVLVTCGHGQEVED